MAVYAAGGNRPRIHPQTFVHPQASIIGRVIIGPGCYVGAGASLRGDWVTIVVGPGSNIQDCCTVHGPVGGEVVLEAAAHLGHGCIVHGAHVGENVLVGMNAVVQDGVVLGTGSIVGAGCVVPAGLEVPPGSLVIGVPGKIVGPVRPDVARRKMWGTQWYQKLAARSLEDFVEVELAECWREDLESGEWSPWMVDELGGAEGEDPPREER